MVPVPVGAKEPPVPTVRAAVLEPVVIALKAKLVVTESAEQTSAPDTLMLL
jgi:hypothetical protein